jgi:hypothetical protein
MPAKKAAKKTVAKKSAKNAAGGIFPPPIPAACLQACFKQYMVCLTKGVDPALCMKRYITCAKNCFIKK